MLFRVGSPPNSLDDAELMSEEWQPLIHPPLWAFHLLGLIVGAVMAFILLVAWTWFTPHFEISFAPTHQVALAGVAIFMAGMLLQLVAHPEMGLNNRSVVGIWLSRLTPYTAYLSKISKRRLIMSLILPFMVLAVLPLLVASVLSINSGWLVFCSCFSAGTFGINGALAVWAAIRIPEKSIVAGRGFQPYWKRQSEPKFPS